MRTAKDLSGQRFGRLTVIRRAEGEYPRPYYECICDCGNKIVVEGKRLTSSNTRSCGCLHRQQLVERNYKHGERYTRLYKTWLSMKQRCSVHRDKYKQWEGRGIKVCEEWNNSFLSFKEWAEANGYNDTLTIDRIDVNGNYEPTNCRWITKAEQQFNKTNTRYFEYKGQKKCLAEWAEIFGMNKPTLYNRVYNLGWSIDKALETEVKTNGRSIR